MGNEMGGGYYDDYDGYGGGYGGDGVDRRHFADKSQAALRRENEAKAAFDKVRKSTEEAGDTATIELLKPSCHLTQVCWSSFSKYVKAAGWKVKRRAASEAEKKAHGETRKATVYFVDVTFTAQNNNKKAPKATLSSSSTSSSSSSSSSSAAGSNQSDAIAIDHESIEDLKEPPTKKAKCTSDAATRPLRSNQPSST